MKNVKVLLLFVLVMLLVGCGTKKTELSNSEHKKLVVGFDAEYPPYGYKDSTGNYTGFDLELAEEVAKRNGWELIKKPINWDSKDMELDSGSIDCIWNGFTITGRESKYTWTDPYVDNSIVVIVNANSGINKVEDLAGKIVNVQADSSGLAALTNKENNEENLALAKSFKKLQQVADYNTALMNLESGATDAVVLDIGVAKYQVKLNGDKFKILNKDISSEQYGVGFKLGNIELKDKVQKTLYDMLADGTIKKIAEKYKNYNLPEMICLGNKKK